MEQYEIIDELAAASKEFRDFFRQVLDMRIERTCAAAGFRDERFIGRVKDMFDDAQTMLSMSAEHRKAVCLEYEACREVWLAEGGKI